MPPKSEADHIQLLLSIIEHIDGKVKWDEVAKSTGLYKEGKFVRQAYNSIKTKYSNATIPAVADATANDGDASKKVAPKTPKRRGGTGESVISSKKKAKTKAEKPADEDELAQGEEGEDEVA